MLSALGAFAQRDLRRGLKAGRLGVRHERLALYATGGTLLGAMRAVLDGEAPRVADILHAEGVLRLLGPTSTMRPTWPGARCPMPGPS